jgi:acyl carrier protein
VTEEELRAALYRALRKVAPESDPARVSPDADLRDELDIDSMDFTNFIIALHRELGVDIPERDYPKYTTLGGCLSELGARLQGRVDVRD